ncbi:lyase family protein [Nesterenkonia sp. DZ6]|uniref:lyase family protein n=1 Tax=Nesterenkonia sp. DZ6 TaxID=2901229 RepID=UPI001F4D208D|nr:lyase family protein [Nesterenkonia sp. DZ6]MCH8560681.1 3-carboxy-cis,cis-muconate cycloisomerase [Nesterenkonia sp. DZ6]
MTGPYGILSPVWAGTATAQLMSEESILRAMLRVEASWAQALADAGEAPAASAAAIVAISEDPARAGLSVEEIASQSPGGGNPVIPMLAAVRRALVEAGESDAALHRGATSQDILDTALMLLCRESVAALLSDARRAGTALSRLSQEHRNSVCVARSLTQHALPTTFGLRCAGWLDGLTQAIQRLELAAAKLPLQWGGAVGTQASLSDSLGPQRAAALTTDLAARLGLRAMPRPWHTQRQMILELAAALAGLLATLGKAAGDVLTLQRPEVAELREPTVPGRGGSSAMPQKQNPVLSTLIRSAALAGPGQLSTLYLAAATAEDERPAGGWHAEWPSLVELARLSGGAATRAAELFEGLVVDPGAMAVNLRLSGDAVLSERLMARLGSSFPGGRQALQDVVRRSAVERVGLRGLLEEHLGDSIAPADLDRLLDPHRYLGRAQEFIDAAVDEFNQQDFNQQDFNQTAAQPEGPTDHA